jgi:hypothetical protein
MFQILMHWRQNSRRVMSGFLELSKTAKMAMMVCGDLRSRTPTVIFCFSVVLDDERYGFNFENAIKSMSYTEMKLWLPKLFRFC